MGRSLLSLASAAGFALTLGIAGCATDDKAPGSAAGDAGGHAHGSGAGVAMMCPKCETTWVRDTSAANRAGVTRYSSGRTMVCEMCDKTAEAQVSEGRVTVHNCPECKVAMVPVKPSPKPMGPR